MSLIQELVVKGLLEKGKANSLRFSVKETGKKEEEIILEKGVVSEDVLFQLKSNILKVPLRDVYPDDVPAEILGLIPEESAKYYQMVPLSKKGDVLEVGMVYPEDIRAQEALQFLARESGFNYKFFLIKPSILENLLRKYKSLKGEIKKALSQLSDEKAGERSDDSSINKKLDKLVEEAPITKVVAVVIRHAVEGRASDIHIEPLSDRTRVRFRVDGILHSSLFLPLRVHPAIVARIKILARLKIDESRIPQDGRFSSKIEGEEIDFRVSTFPTAMGEKVALRILDPAMGKKSFDELGLVQKNLATLQEAIKKPFGTILVTGPTGSGKTTTLYAILNIVNKEGVNVLTVEDPVEYYIEGANQSEVRPEIGYDFPNALRYILRQDPDIIMVGEIRDEETANLATHAALTGHMLLSTLHTNNAVGAIPRLIDMGIKPFLIAPTLNSILSQRLLRRLCSYCKVEMKPSFDIEEMILKDLKSISSEARKNTKIPSDISIFEAKGCKRCNFRGYLGRIGIFEILKMTDSLAQIIRKNPSEGMIREEGIKQGMVTMRQDGILKALKGVTTIEEVLRVTVG